MSGRGAVRVGTSGWQYRDWRGSFYPADLPQRRWFEHYASCFPTVEINATFYRLPRTTTVERWRDQAPAGFRFAVKGSRYLTHNKKLNDPADSIALITGRMQPLGDAHGVWLWQLPPNLHRDVSRLDGFLGALPGGARHAVELRHASWYDSEVEEVLRRHGAAWVWLSDRQMPDVCPTTADFVYLRLHGLDEDPQARYRWDYSVEELRPWVDALGRAAEDGRDAWVYFNNDAAGNAPRNATTLIDLLGHLALPWP